MQQPMSEAGAAHGKDRLAAAARSQRMRAVSSSMASEKPSKTTAPVRASTAALPMLLRSVRLEGSQVDESHRELCLPGEMQAQVGLRHRRHRMMPHGRMAVDAVPDAVGFGEQVPEDDGAAQVRRSDHNRHGAGAKHFAAQFHGAADAAHAGRTIKGRADFVVIDRSSQPPHGAKDCGQVAAHPMGTAAAAFTGDSHGAAIRKSCDLARARRMRKQDGLDAVKRQRFEHVGRAGKVVAIPGVQRAR